MVLVVSRKNQEKISIGEDIIITVVAISKGKVGLGIEAPKNIRIERIPSDLEKGDTKYEDK